MSDFYTEMQGIATDLLTEFNQGVIQLVRRTQGNGPGYNPGDPAEAIHTLKGAARGVSKRFVDGTLIVESDLQVTVAVHPTVKPLPTDAIRIDGRDYQIVAIKPIPPAGVTVSNVIIFR